MEETVVFSILELTAGSNVEKYLVTAVGRLSSPQSLGDLG